MSHLFTRRRMLAAKGRPMSLQRPNDPSPPANLTVQGYLAAFAPDQIAPPRQQGDGQVQILNDEIANAAWPGPPVSGDWLVIDGATWAVKGAVAVYEGSTLIGFSIWVRGGTV